MTFVFVVVILSSSCQILKTTTIFLTFQVKVIILVVMVELVFTTFAKSIYHLYFQSIMWMHQFLRKVMMKIGTASATAIQTLPLR